MRKIIKRIVRIVPNEQEETAQGKGLFLSAVSFPGDLSLSAVNVTDLAKQ